MMTNNLSFHFVSTLISALILTSGCASFTSHHQEITTVRKPAQVTTTTPTPTPTPTEAKASEGLSEKANTQSIASGQVSPDYGKIFSQVRETLKLTSHTARRPKKDPAETPLVEAIQKSPDLILADRKTLIETVEQESHTAPDPTKHLRLIPPTGSPGYEDLKIYSSHAYYGRAKKYLVPAHNLVQVWSDFLKLAEHQIILNVFDFDLMEVAEVLAEQASRGIDVHIGIDKGTISTRPEVKLVYERLVKAGAKVTAVNSVSLNHQKMAALDWDHPHKSKALFSSGNLTQSCLGAEGDLKSIPESIRPRDSVPNANHVLTLKSWLLSTLVHHELTKTLDPEFQYRGTQFPLTGSYQVTGPGVDPNTLEAHPKPSLVISFSPGGAYRNINKNIIAHFIRKSDGPIRMTQFAYSSKEVALALRERAQKDFQTKGNFDFVSVGDTPFAVQYWSQFLKMSGLELIKLSPKKKLYESDPKNDWNLALSPLQMDILRKKIRVAPIQYGTHHFKLESESYPYTAKIHHKMLSTGPFAIVGTSFNFSEGAENNNEQILVFHDPQMSNFVRGVTEWLADQSPRSVYEEAIRRNDRTFKAETLSENQGPGI